jgi:MFS family permease
MNACVPALYVETQQVLEEMERARPGIFGKRGAVAQAFGIQTMSSFMGLFLGPLWGGFVEYRFGWKTMAGTLGLLAAVTAVPMLWLSNGAPGEAVEGTEGERERLLAGERREEADGNVRV